MKRQQTNPKKVEQVQHLIKLIKSQPIVGVVNLEGLPTPQLQNMRANLRGRVDIFMTKKRLIRIALDEAKKDKPGIEALGDKLRGMPAIIATSESPFILFKTLQKSKSSAPAKAGQTAPSDIVVPAGPTPFAPGPVIGELGAIGVKAGIENGKVAVKADSVVVKEGETISAQVAGLLTRLGIEPMEVGLDLIAAYEDGTIFGKDVLGVDEQEYVDNIIQGHTWAFNLAVETVIPNSMTLPVLIAKAFDNAEKLEVSQGIIGSHNADKILARAQAQAQALHAIVS